jgi:hypothetical protein
MDSLLKALMMGLVLILSPIPIIIVLSASVVVFTAVWLTHALLTAAFKVGA